MATFKLIQVSDTHLSRERPFFVPNWDAVVAHVNAAQPDLLLNSGDIALNGENVPDDLAFAAEQHARLGVPVRAIPGNHDIGDNPSPGSHGEGITDQRRQVYQGHFGAEQWTMVAGDWYFIALNAQLLGSGLPAESDQWAFLEQAFALAGDRPVALFMHKPLFRDTPDEAHEAAGRYVLRGPRARLLGLARQADLRLVACGHVHQHRMFEHEGVRHVWAPSTAFILPDAMQPRIGTKEVGLVEYDFDGTGVAVRFVTPAGARHLDLVDVPGAYGDLRARLHAPAHVNP
jgi:3',5'-cyclic AMP phosphodiesterase CpdA